MTYRGLRVAWAVVALVAVLVAFLVAKTLDEADPLGMPSGVWVTEASPGATSADLLDAVSRFSASQGVDVARVDVDLHDPVAGRVVHVSPGGDDTAGAQWLRDGYPGFSRDVGTTVQPWGAQLDRDPRAAYLVGGDLATADRLLDTLDAVGFGGRTLATGTFREMLRFGLLANSSLVALLMITALAVVVLVAASVLANAKTYGVRRLHGRSFGSQLVQDARTLARGVLGVWVVVAGAGLVALRLYNGWGGLSVWATWVGVLVAVGLVVLVGTHVAALAWTYRTPIVAALKGDVETGPAAVGAYVARWSALVVTLVVASQAVATVGDLGAMNRAQERFAGVGEASFLVLNGSVYDQEGTDLERRVGAWLEEADARGEVLVAAVDGTQYYGADLADLPPTPVLVVNSAFLERSEVRLASGDLLQVPASVTEVTVAVPEPLADDAARIADVLVGALDPAGNNPVAHRTVATRTGQRVFTFGAGSRVEAETELVDPVVVVAPAAARAITTVNYMAYASQYGVIVPSPAFVQEATAADPLLEEYVIGIQPVATQAAQRLSDTAATLRLQVTNSLLGIGVLVVTAAAAALVHARRNAQTTMARWVHGWTFVATHRALVAAEAALAVAVGVWLVRRLQPPAPPDLPPGVPPPPPNPAQAAAAVDAVTAVSATLTLLLCGAVVVVLTVRRLDRRLLKEMSAGA